MSAAQQAQRIKTAYLKHKTLHNPVCIMEQGPATTGRAAEEARADEESRTESESDGAADSPSGSALASCSKRLNFGILGIWSLFLKSSVQARLTTLSMLS